MISDYDLAASFDSPLFDVDDDLTNVQCQMLGGHCHTLGKTSDQTILFLRHFYTYVNHNKRERERERGKDRLFYFIEFIPSFKGVQSTHKKA